MAVQQGLIASDINTKVCRVLGVEMGIAAKVCKVSCTFYKHLIDSIHFVVEPCGALSRVQVTGP